MTALRRLRWFELMMVAGIAAWIGVAPKPTAAAKKKQAPRLPQLVICTSEHSPQSKALKERLTNDAAVVPLASRFQITYLDVDNDPQRNMFVNQFSVKGLLEPPILGFAAPDGTAARVVRDVPKGEALPQLLTEMLAKLEPKPGPKAKKPFVPRDKKGG